MLTGEQLAQISDIAAEFMAGVTKIIEASQSASQEPVEARTEGKLSIKVLREIASHEGAVREAYRDSKGIWTWGIGVTNASGHSVYPRYKDNPQEMSKVLGIYEWLLRTKYLPDVEAAFKGVDLTEEQLAAALSFHYNTGAIKRASWVKSFKAGNINTARSQFMNWKSPKEIIPRRQAERDLFFDGKWSGDGTVNIYEVVNKPSYSPKWSSLKKYKLTEKDFE